jgi:hypothetical protein
MHPHKQNGHHAQQCDACGKPIHRNLKGRLKRFCSDACRLEAHRTNKISILGRGEGLQRNDSKNPCGSRGNSSPKSGSSLFCNGPLDLLGGGSWHWPKAGSLDGRTLTKIMHSEIGDEVMPDSVFNSKGAV